MNSLEIQPASEIADRVKEALRAEPGLRLAMLYGSAATGTMRQGSDVDLALLFDSPLGAERKMDLILRLENGLRRDVDLVDLFSLSGTILKQVLHKGRVLIQTKPGELAGLVRKMIYNQADMMPYVSRALIERQRRFIHG
jgi:predicted nucleotidyltransferase